MLSIKGLLASTPLVAVLMLSPLSASAQTESTTTSIDIKEINSTNADDANSKIATSIAISQDAFSNADTVLLARVDDYADALAGSVLAKKYNAPVLFTETSMVSDAVKTEISRLNANKVIILGNESAVSKNVEMSLGVNTERIGGKNRYETALAIAKEVAGEDGPKAIFFVEGQNVDSSRGWPDAISASAVAANMGAIILPVDAEVSKPEILEAYKTYVTANTRIPAYVVGGEKAVPAAIKDELDKVAKDAGGNKAERISGGNRYDTNSEVFAKALSYFYQDSSTRYVVSGDSYVDGIAAAAAASKDGGQLLMSKGSPDTVMGGQAPASNRDLISKLRLIDLDDQSATQIKAQATKPMGADFCLTILHNNDNEGTNTSDGRFGGMARIKPVYDREEKAAHDNGCATVKVHSGDAFLAGTDLASSGSDNDDLNKPVNVANALAKINYDTITVGNHELDFGPRFFARFINSLQNNSQSGYNTYVTSNLLAGGQSEFSDILKNNAYKASKVVEVSVGDRTEKVGIVGATTWDLPNLVGSLDQMTIQTTIDDAAAKVQSEVDSLTDQGVKYIILTSHLQDIENEHLLINKLKNVDAVIAGGGHEYLFDKFDPIDANGAKYGVKGGAYPHDGTDADNNYVPIATAAQYNQYVGRLVLNFDENGKLAEKNGVDHNISRMVRVADETVPGGVKADQEILDALDKKVEVYQNELANTTIGTTEVDLDGTRGSVRTSEANVGNMMADAHVWFAKTYGKDKLIANEEVIGLQNGGGLRNKTVLKAGETISGKWVKDTAAFVNIESLKTGVDAQKLKDVLETAYSGLPGQSGGFMQVSSNLKVVVDISQTAQKVAGDKSKINITTPGERVRSIQLTKDDGTTIDLVKDGQVVNGAPKVTVASIDFSLNNGDSYPFNYSTSEFVYLTGNYDDALWQYIEKGLKGVVKADQYPLAENIPADKARIVITGNK